MKEFIMLLGMMIVMAIVAFFVMFKLSFPSASVRYMLTVEVEADGEIYTGFGVHEFKIGRQPGLLAAPTSWSDFEGEAFAIDIGDRGTLFMLLSGPRCCVGEPFRPDLSYSGAESLMMRVFDAHAGSSDAVRALRRLRIDQDLTTDEMPMLVRFEDIDDPMSIALVDPNDLSASFGEGVSLRRVHIQTTRRWLTGGIERRLPWLSELDNRRLDGSSRQSNQELANRLHMLSFQQ